MAPVICPNCGRSTPEGKFCEHCGASLLVLPVYVSVPVPPAPPKQERSTLTTILIILCAFFVILIVLAMIGYMMGSSIDQGSNPDKITTIQPTPKPTSIITPVKTSQTYSPTYRPTYTTTSYSSWHSGTTMTIQIQNKYYYYYTIDMKKGDMKKISLITDGSPIDLMVMDSTNFKIYKEDEENPKLKNMWQSWNQLSIITTEFPFNAPSDDTYYFVLDNTNYPSIGAYANNNVNVAVTFSSYY